MPFLLFVIFIFFPILATTDGVANTRKNHDKEKESFIVAADKSFSSLIEMCVAFTTSNLYFYAKLFEVCGEISIE